MNFKRIGRLLVCLVLVAALLVQVSPIRARAVTAETVVVVGGAAVAVISALLVGIGVMSGEDSTDWNYVRDQAVQWATERGFVDADGNISLFRYQHEDGTYRLYADGSLLDALFGWIYDSGTVSNDSIFLTEWALDIGGYNYIYRSDDPFAALHMHYTYSSGSCCSCYIFTQVEGATFQVYKNGAYNGWDRYNKSVGSFFCRYLTGSTSSGSVVCNGDYGDALFIEGAGYATSDDALASLFAAAASGTLSTSMDLTLGEVAPAGTAIADGYSTWAGNTIAIPGETDDDTITGYPIGVPGTTSDPEDYTQEGAWNGSLPIPVPDSDAGTTTPDVEPEPDVTPDTDALTQAGFDASLASFLASLGAKLAEWFERQFGILDAILGVIESILNIFTPIAEWFEALITGQISIVDSIIALPGAIGDIFENIIGAAVDVLLVGIEAIFVPSEDFLTVKVESIRARFEIADSIMATGEAIRGMLTSLGGEPPVIYIHLEDSEGSYDYGGTVPILDMRWYERYKPTGDKLLSSLIWLFFAWRCFVHAPNIISGIAGNIEAFNIPSDGVYTKDSGGLLGGNSWLGTWNEYQRGKYESKRKSRR